MDFVYKSTARGRHANIIRVPVCCLHHLGPAHVVVHSLRNRLRVSLRQTGRLLPHFDERRFTLIQLAIHAGHKSLTVVAVIIIYQ